MATLGSKLITKEMTWNANMTEQNHLGAALIAEPTKLMGKMDQLFSSSNYYSDNPLSSLLMGTSTGEETITGTSWEWELKGANTRPLVIIENVLPVSLTKPGQFKTSFNYKLKIENSFSLPFKLNSPRISSFIVVLIMLVFVP